MSFDAASETGKKCRWPSARLRHLKPRANTTRTRKALGEGFHMCESPAIAGWIVLLHARTLADRDLVFAGELFAGLQGLWGFNDALFGHCELVGEAGVGFDADRLAVWRVVDDALGKVVVEGNRESAV